MYQNLENVLKPFAHKDGRTLKLAAVMILLLGFLAVIVIREATWKNNKVSIILIGALAVCYIAAIPLGRLKTRWNIRKNFARFTEAQLQRMDMECGDTTPTCGVVVTSHALACEKNLIPLSDIVWIYVQNSTQSGVATINYLNVIDKYNKRHRVPLFTKVGALRKANPEAVREIEKQLLKRSPGIYCGYSKDIVRMYRENFAGMIAHVEEKFAQTHGR